MLIRLFRGVIREGAHDRLIRGLHDHVLPRLEAHPGVMSTTLAVAMEGSPDEYLMESHWRDLDDLIPVRRRRLEDPPCGARRGGAPRLRRRSSLRD